MSFAHGRRHAFSLIELLVVLGIFALLLGIILPAIQNVRDSAAHTQSRNNLRQIMLGVHLTADEKAGKIDNLTRTDLTKRLGGYTEQALFWVILPYTHRPHPHIDASNVTVVGAEFFHPVVKVYRSPGDPTPNGDEFLLSVPAHVSYAFNMKAVSGSIAIPFSFPDGTSTTIGVSEKHFASWDPQIQGRYTWSDYTRILGPINAENVYRDRRATFADKDWQDVVPVTDAATGRTVASERGRTFQYRPKLAEIDPHVTHTQFRAGLPVAMFDGSVRTLHPSIEESVYWALVTPNGGEVIAGDY